MRGECEKVPVDFQQFILRVPWPGHKTGSSSFWQVASQPWAFVIYFWGWDQGLKQPVVGMAIFVGGASVGGGDGVTEVLKVSSWALRIALIGDRVGQQC